MAKKIIEGLWDCPYCGQKGIGGLTKSCPNCAHPQDAGTKFYLGEKKEYLEEDKADIAPYWYVRHGMDDRDNSFGKETEIYYAALNNSSIKDLDFEFAWLQPHSGNYDVQEAYAWLKGVLG